MELNLDKRKEIIDCLLSDENEHRKYQSQKNQDFYENRHKEYIYDKLNDCYGKSYVESQQNFISINITPKIINESARIYERSPDRLIEGANESQQQEILDYFNACKYDEVMKEANRLYKLHNQALLHVYPKDGMLIKKLYNPCEYDVIPDEDNPERAFAIVLPVAQYEDITRLKQIKHEKHMSDDNRAKLRFVWWTDELNFETDGNGQLIDEEIRHGLGRLPFVEISKQKAYEYWVDHHCGAVDFSEDFICYVADLCNISKLQGFSQAVISAEKAPDHFNLGPKSVLFLPQDENSNKDPKFEFVSPSPDLGSMLKILESKLSIFMTSMGLDPKKLSFNGESQTFNSGIERFMAQMQDFQNSQEDIALFRSFEIDLFDLLKRWSQELSLTEVDIPFIADNFELVVNFSGPEAMLTESEKVSIIKQKLDLGLISLVEAVAKDRGISLEEAQELLNQRRVNNALENDR